MRYGALHYGVIPGAMPPVFRRADQADDPAPTARRFDRADLLPAETTPEGYLVVEGFVARPGIYVYRNADGTKRRELVPAAMLHDRASLDTLARKPVTLNHKVGPDGWVFVDPSNVATLGVGTVGGPEDIEVADDRRVIVRMAIHRRDAIDAINAGTHELSPQYDAAMQLEPGTDPEFGAYDCVQISRTYNAVAIVPTARGGSTMHLRADSADAEIDYPTASDTGETMIKLHPFLVALLTAGLVKRADGLAPDAPMADGAKIDGADVLAAKMDAYGKIADMLDMGAASPADVLAKILAMIEAAKPKAPAADAKPPVVAAPVADAAPGATPAPPVAPKADAADFETRAIKYADERTSLVELARKLEVKIDGLGNAALRKALAMKIRPEARADAADDYYRGIVDVAASSVGDPMGGLRFDGKPPAKHADGAQPEDQIPAFIRHMHTAHNEAAPKPS